MPSGPAGSQSRCLIKAARSPLGWLLCAALLWVTCSASVVAQDRPSEYDVEAAYLFNFGKFVYFPADAPKSSNFDICIVGASPIAQALEKTALNERIDDRAVRVVQHDKAADARACAVVFLSGAEADRIDKDLAALEGSDALIVGESPQFIDRGGMIQFLIDHNRVRFAVNLQAVGRTRLQLSSELLKVAQFVKTKPAETRSPQEDKK
jgi:YfiR/HmsC-like